jgi:hypothetical protein
VSQVANLRVLKIRRLYFYRRLADWQSVIRQTGSLRHVDSSIEF